jgi:hypothetical protein
MFKNMKLNDIAKKYGTDKENSRHGYVNIYEEHFESEKLKYNKILEIGVRQGSSHKMWYDYFPNSMVYGVDNWHGPNNVYISGPGNQSKLVRNTKSVKRPSKLWSESSINKPFNDRIKIFTGDQEDEKFLNESFKEQLDLIIDDGGHRMSHQQNSLRIMFKKLNSGCFYVIEDLHTSKEPLYWDTNDVKSTTLWFLKNLKNIKEKDSFYIKGEELQYIKDNADTVKFYCNDKLCIIKKK